MNIIIESLRRLSRAYEGIQSIKGLSLHLSTNVEIHVMTDGRLSIPTDWI